MYKYFTFAIIVFSIIKINAHDLTTNQLDSLYNLFVDFKSGKFSGESAGQLVEHNQFSKCGFGFINSITFNFDKFSPKQQEVLLPLLQRPVKETSIVSPSGLFRIHYDTTGGHVPFYSVQETAEAFDYSYHYEVNVLGYAAPPGDGTAGGDNLYDVYIENISPLYGYTVFEFSGGNTGASYIVIQNNYQNYYTKGINAVKVTAAHEYHHAIQGGSYIFRSADTYFYEISSTAMEEFVYPEINDYIAYLPAYFNNPGQSMPNTQGYELAIWNIFLEKRFGHDLLRRQWELMPSMRALQAIDESLRERNALFKEEFNTFGIWTYFTRHRKQPERYFEEGEFYPLIRPDLQPINTQPPADSVTFNGSPVSNNFIVFTRASPQSATGRDTLVAIITNMDIPSGINNPQNSSSFKYVLYHQEEPGGIKLTDYYYVRMEMANPGIWTASEILNYQVIKEGLVADAAAFVFPSPFIYNQSTTLYIPAEADLYGEVDMNIYSSGMELIFEGRMSVLNNTVRWFPRTNKNQNLSSGVYLYVIKTGNNVKKGKFVVINNE
jgi:hypothetical protein